MGDRTHFAYAGMPGFTGRWPRAAPPARGSFELTATDFLELGNALHATYPMIFGWNFKSTALGSNGGPIVFNQATPGANKMVAWIDAGGTARVQRIDNAGTTVGNVGTSTAWTALAWHHGLAIFEDADTHSVYLNGAGVGASAAAGVIGPLDRFRIGHQQIGVTGAPYQVANVCVASAVPSAGQIAALAAGDNPAAIFGADLEEHWRMNEGSLVGVNGNVLTNSGCVANLTDGPVLA